MSVLFVVTVGVFGLGYFALCLFRPGWGLGVVAAIWLVFDDVAGSAWNLEPVYSGAGFGVLRAELLALIWIAAIWLRVLHERKVRVPPFGFLFGVGLLTVGIAVAVALGISKGVSFGVVASEANGPVMVLLVASATFQWLRHESQIRAAAVLLLTVVSLKSAVMIVLYVGGTGIALQGRGQISTSLDPVVNVMMVAVICGAFAVAFFSQAERRRWSLIFVPLPLVALILSDRRSFILGLFLGLAVIVVLASAYRKTLRVWLLVGMLLASAFVATRPAGSSDAGGGGVASLVTLQSLGPSRASSDRYRVSERHAVIHAVSSEGLLSGLGFGVEWLRERPLPSYIPETGTYVHSAALWYWMKMGALGFMAYMVLMVGSATHVSLALLRGPRQDLSVASMVVVAVLATSLFADTTAAFSGSNKRYAILVGFIVGAGFALPRRGEQSRENIATLFEVPDTRDVPLTVGG